MIAQIPLSLKLKKKTERDIAYAQDIIVAELYKFFPNAIIHGGTAIWRCYNGNRFSEDVDVYISRDLSKIEEFFKSLENIGFKIIKKRVKEASLYSELEFNRTPVRFEATYQAKKQFLKKYETSESFFINVYTLSPEDLVIEKVETYLKRRKIRDLYDISFLISHVENRKRVEDYLKKLIKNYEKPIDEENLSRIIIMGAIPSSDELLKEIIRWAK
jgi:predicted nucleotidyltransferase component of viral defense system